MSTALDGVVVVDLTTEFWSSLSSAMLGDFGADVIRVEEVNGPGPHLADERRDEDAPYDYEAELAQRNKRNLALDLSKEDARALLRELVLGADVLMTDWSTARLESCDISEQALAEAKPQLIFARGSAFGPSGPDADAPPLDALAAARTGMMPILPQPGEPPVYTASGEMYGCVLLAFGVATALFHRARSGEGQAVATSLLAGNSYGAALDVQAFLAMGGDRFLEPVSRLDAGNPMSGTVYMTEDERWITLTMPDTARWWPHFCDLVSLDENDERFDTHDKRCGESRLEMMQVLEAAFRTKPAAHWKQVFDERQLSADVIEDYSFPAEDPQARKNRYILDLEHPSLGAISTLGFPIHMSDTPARLDRMAPCRGQHSDEVLHERLGCSAARILELREAGVVA